MLKNRRFTMSKRRILTDVMLAKVARWLRLAGIPAMDVPAQGDDAILRHSKRSKAILLTSDVALSLRARKRGITSILVTQHDLDRQLAYVIRSLRLNARTDPAETFCPRCCSPLNRVSPEFASRRGIPDAIASRYNGFYYCRRCGKLYWQGTHWISIRKRLARVARLAARNSAL